MMMLKYDQILRWKNWNTFKNYDGFFSKDIVFESVHKYKIYNEYEYINALMVIYNEDC